MPDVDEREVRAVCRHHDDDPDARHTIPTIVDLAVGWRLLWPVARWISDLVGVTAARLSLYLGLVGLAYQPVDYLIRFHDWLAILLLPTVLLPPVVVIGHSLAMGDMHRRLDDGDNATVEDLAELVLLRKHRLLVLIGFGMCVTPPIFWDEVIGWLAFVVFPLYACALGGKPKSKLRDRASEASRRLRELLAGVRPRPAWNPA